VITRRQATFAIAYVCSFVALAAVGYAVGDYSFRAKTHKVAVASTVVEGDTAFYDLPHVNLTVSSSGGDSNLVRIDMSLEVQKSDLARLDGYAPRIADHLVSYLRTHDLDTLREVGQEHQLKDKLLEETNKAAYPVQVMDIVFRRFIVL
jgi:flagellar basal body-associated protein FliL